MFDSFLFSVLRLASKNPPELETCFNSFVLSLLTSWLERPSEIDHVQFPSSIPILSQLKQTLRNLVCLNIIHRFSLFLARRSHGSLMLFNILPAFSIYRQSPAIRSDHEVARGSEIKEKPRSAKKPRGQPKIARDPWGLLCDLSSVLRL